MTKPIETVLLDDVVGGLRTSASSNADLIPLLQSTNDAVKDLARNQANKGSDTSTMLPLMMMMMNRR
jgi:hypothetical protein